MAGRRQQIFLWKRFQPSTMCGSASKDTVHKAINKYNEFPFNQNAHLLDHCKLPSIPCTQAHYSSSKLPTALRCRQARQQLVSHTFPVIMNFLMLQASTSLAMPVSRKCLAAPGMGEEVRQLLLNSLRTHNVVGNCHIYIHTCMYTYICVYMCITYVYKSMTYDLNMLL